jgi:hypothetical protein
MPAVEFPDVEALLVAFIKAETSLTKVGTKVANPRPPRYVRLSRTGGGAMNRVVERAQVTFTAGGAAAHDDAQACRSALLNRYTQMPLVRAVHEVTGPYFDPDPDTAEDRYTFTVELIVRGHRA